MNVLDFFEPTLGANRRAQAVAQPKAVDTLPRRAPILVSMGIGLSSMYSRRLPVWNNDS